MKINLILVFLFTCLLSNIRGQDSASINQNAIGIERQDSLGEDIYDVISGYQLFLIGEGHGTKEPARFVQSLAELLLRKGNHVQIGLEIPSEQMKTYLSSPKNSNAYTSEFFINKPYDGRPCFAWADLIARLSGRHDVEFFFYDINFGEFKDFEERDSLMYLKIKKRIQLHPDWKTITLGGNIHAMLRHYNGKTKMGLYLRDDKDLQIEKRLLSIDHCYATGSYWDNSNNTLQIFQADDSYSILATAVDYENYLYLCSQIANKNFNAIYFTRKLTASPLVGQK